MDKYIQKYKNKLRLLVVYTDSYKNKDYLDAKNIYQDNIKEFHKRYVKMIVYKYSKNNTNPIFKIQLIGFDGTVKHTYNKMNKNNIFRDIEKMPMGNVRNPINLSLYEDYNKETTIKGLGFKNKNMALETIKKIKNKSLTYQKNVIITMYNRAKHHPYRNKDMEEAMKVFKKWLSKYNP